MIGELATVVIELFSNWALSEQYDLMIALQQPGNKYPGSLLIFRARVGPVPIEKPLVDDEFHRLNGGFSRKETLRQSHLRLHEIFQSSFDLAVGLHFLRFDGRFRAFFLQEINF